MYIKDTNILFTWTLKATDLNYPASDYDLVIKKPDGSVTFTEDLTEDSFVAPTSTTDGSIAVTLSFDMAGLHEVVLSRGTSTAYQELKSAQISVVEATSTYDTDVELV